ncbi:MAG: histidine kinase dimerization/phospho-acceptor domain-containing protein, partial [Alphaproteobacteria bacterium]
VLSVFFAAIGLASVGYNAFRKDVAAMQAASLEDITWASFQLEQELGRFRESLILFQVEGSREGVAEVNKRFDILWSRIAIFNQGGIGERLSKYDHETQIISRLFSDMKTVDRRIVELAEGNKAEAAALSLIFEPYANELRVFSRSVTLGEELRGREIREQFQSGVGRTLQLGALAIVIAFASLAYINRESMRYKRLADTNLKLADVADKASRAKTKFLTMMSHELRTPMNGVLGLLALSKQSAVQQSQIRLIEHAEQSGRQMVDLLTDILDFSALYSDEIRLEVKPFEVDHLATAVREQFAPIAKREGVSFSVSLHPECPRHMQGDFCRLRQISIHLARYVVETAGVRDAEMNFSCQDNTLSMQLSFAYSSDGGEWTPDLILGNEERGEDSFTTDALGPAIARGVIEVMHGRLRVDTPIGGRITVIVSIPVEEYVTAALNVTVLSSTDAMGAICRAALAGVDVNFLQEDDNAPVHIALIEAGSATETEFLKLARQNFPTASLIALGAPVDAEAFDFTVNLPLNFHEIRDIVGQRVA